MPVFDRIIIGCLDGCGVGPERDARKFGGMLPNGYIFDDRYSNTLRDVSKHMAYQKKVKGRQVIPQTMKTPNMNGLGLRHTVFLYGQKKPEKVHGAYGKLSAVGVAKAKSTISGHRGAMGLPYLKGFKLYPHIWNGQSFPDELLEQINNRIEGEIGERYEFICNLCYSGTKAIKDYGQEHEDSEGEKLILYTNYADSVLQIAANEKVTPVKELYNICKTVSKIVFEKTWNMERVITRPYVIKEEDGKIIRPRTANRKDFVVPPYGHTILDKLVEEGYTVEGIGKIGDIFCEQGITRSFHTTDKEALATINELGYERLSDVQIETNPWTIEKTKERIKWGNADVTLTNFNDTDSAFGHRNDIEGFANCFVYFDGELPDIKERMNEDDLLILFGDHGCNPCYLGTDHTREYGMFLIYGEKVKPVNLGTRKFSDIGATVSENFLGKNVMNIGKSFLREITA